MKVKIKKLHPKAIIPVKKHETDAGLDLTAINMNWNKDYIEYETGIAIKLPKGTMGLIFPRSSISDKTLILSNSVGVIDENYIGEIKFRFKCTKDSLLDEKIYKIGDRVGQLVIVPIPLVELEEVNELETTDRGEKGFGSSGR